MYIILLVIFVLVNYTTKELDLVARLMRAEALGEGNLGMLMVGNVIVNRAIANCDVFKDIRSLYDVVYQNPGGFSGVNSSLFYSSSTTHEKNLAKRVIVGEYYHPATHSLWFYAPGTGKSCNSNFYNQPLSGKYKNHCFYNPKQGFCPELY